jgi:hypothetical protein
VQPGRNVGAKPRGENQALGGGSRRECVEYITQHGAQVEVALPQFELAGFDLREVEDVVDDVEQALARTVERLQAAALLLGKGCGEEQFGDAEHAVHRRADFVAHVGEKLRLGTARRLRRFLGGIEFDAQADRIAGDSFEAPAVRQDDIDEQESGAAGDLQARDAGSQQPQAHGDQVRPARGRNDQK